MLSDLLILKGPILDDCVDSLMLLILAKVNLWISVRVHLHIGTSRDTQERLSMYSHYARYYFWIVVGMQLCTNSRTHTIKPYLLDKIIAIF